MEEVAMCARLQRNLSRPFTITGVARSSNAATQNVFPCLHFFPGLHVFPCGFVCPLVFFHHANALDRYCWAKRLWSHHAIALDKYCWGKRLL